MLLSEILPNFLHFSFRLLREARLMALKTYSLNFFLIFRIGFSLMRCAVEGASEGADGRADVRRPQHHGLVQHRVQQRPAGPVVDRRRDQDAVRLDRRPHHPRRRPPPRPQGSAPRRPALCRQGPISIVFFSQDQFTQTNSE